MSRPFQLLFAIHNHQPDGNFGHVFEQAYVDCYGPLIDALVASPHVKVSLHHTGALFEWIEHNRPDYFDKMRLLVQRGQAELLGGGFYEPMLAVLPERDARGQIDMMSAYLEKHFGVRPEGMWLAERVWEPALAKVIADAGMRFTLVDDGHFRSAGMDGTLRGYYVTEKAGTPLAIFPIDKSLRDSIPFMKAHESVDVIARLGRETPPGMVAGGTYGDDGEKFGVWPHTKQWVWAPGNWLTDFFRMLGERRHEVETAHFGAFMRQHPPTGRVYLPTASYEEMGEWTLPAGAQRTYNDVKKALSDRGELERARPYVRGGIWQNFLAKYPEANFMHKKMVEVSDLLARAEGQRSQAMEDARRELYRAQCNCSYWHGLFGGLYLNYLRDTVYRHLIDAELAARGALGEPLAPSVTVKDVDSDLRDEVVLANDQAAVYVKPDQGGGVYELDFRPKRFNLLNVLSRREEGYHQKLAEALRQRAQGGGAGGGGPKSIHDLVEVKSAGLEDLLVYDRHPRLGFVEHVLADDVTLDGLASGRYQERGDFAGAPYEVIAHGAKGGAASVTLRRHGRVGDRALTLEKTLTLEGGRLAARYRLVADGPQLSLLFAPEVSLTLLAGDAPDRYYRVPGRELAPADRKLASKGALEPGQSLELVNEWDKFLVRVSAEPQAALWRYPIETASQSEGGFERTYQGSVVTALFRVTVGGGHAAEAAFFVDLVQL